ncbi:MAG: hypothetical protein AVDCRST_MAG19-3, partial [uncultured Thermomicrobiales bacterium]
ALAARNDPLVPPPPRSVVERVDSPPDRVPRRGALRGLPAAGAAGRGPPRFPGRGPKRPDDRRRV